MPKTWYNRVVDMLTVLFGDVLRIYLLNMQVCFFQAARSKPDETQMNFHSAAEKMDRKAFRLLKRGKVTEAR